MRRHVGTRRAGTRLHGRPQVAQKARQSGESVISFSTAAGGAAGQAAGRAGRRPQGGRGCNVSPEVGCGGGGSAARLLAHVRVHAAADDERAEGDSRTQSGAGS